MYKHADREVADGVVLWFGADEYEGLGCTYSYRNRTIYDNDGERLPTKSLDWYHLFTDKTCSSRTGARDLCSVCHGRRVNRRAGGRRGDVQTLRTLVTQSNCHQLDEGEYKNGVGLFEACCDKCDSHLWIECATATATASAAATATARVARSAAAACESTSETTAVTAAVVASAASAVVRT